MENTKMSQILRVYEEFKWCIGQGMKLEARCWWKILGRLVDATE